MKITGPLTDEQLRSFKENGFLHIPGLVPAQELAAAQRDTKLMIDRGIDRQIDDPDYLYGMDALDNNRKCLFRINNLLTRHAPNNETFKLLLAYPPLLSAINQAVGGDHFVSSVHSTVFKVPHRGYPVPWHQDPVQVFRFPVFNVDIYLDEATTENGCLYVIPGSHLAGYHPGLEFIHNWTQGLEENAPGAIAVPTKPGDVLFHSTSVLHGSYWNRSNSMRRTIYFHIDHLQDIKLQPAGKWPREGYLPSQGLMVDAIARRKAAHPDETPFAYRTVKPEEIM